MNCNDCCNDISQCTCWPSGGNSDRRRAQSGITPPNTLPAKLKESPLSDVRATVGEAPDSVEEDLEKAYWEFDARQKGYGEWKNRPQSERDAFKHAVRNWVPLRELAYDAQIERNRHDAEELEAVRMCLDKEGVKRSNIAGEVYSTWGRVCRLIEAKIANAFGEPIAWLHDQPDRVDVCHDEAKKVWLACKPKHVEHYSIPLYRRAADKGEASHTNQTVGEGWISVEDRLPATAEHVLMAVGANVCIGFRSKCDEGLWVSEYGHHIKAPTYWQPKPTAPEGLNS